MVAGKWGARSYLDKCATLGVHTCTVYRTRWDFVDAVNWTPFLDVDFQLSSSSRRLADASGLRSRRNSSFGNVCGSLDRIAVEQEQALATDVPCVADYNSMKGFYEPDRKTEQRAAAHCTSSLDPPRARFSLEFLARPLVTTSVDRYSCRKLVKT